jgi:hypothetical protein
MPRVLKNFYEWFYAPQPTISLALYRIGTGLVSLLSVLLFAPYLREFFSKEGYVTSQIVQGITASGGGGNGFSVLFWNDSLALVNIAYAILVIALVCYICGIYSQVAAFIAYVGYLSFYNRFTLIGYGGSEVLIMALFFATFIPTDRALIFKWYQNLRGWKKLPEYIGPGWGARLMQINLGIIYFFASSTKLRGYTWMNGTELLGILNYQYATWNFAWLSKFPLIVAAMNYFAVIAEVLFPFLIWFRDARRIILLLGIMLNAGIALSLQVTFFGEAMISCLMLFVIPEDIALIKKYFLIARKKLLPTW